MNKIRDTGTIVGSVGLLTASNIALAQTSLSTNAPLPPLSPKTASMPPQAAPDMQAVFDVLAALGPKSIETLTPVKAGIQPSAADATKAVMRKRGILTAPDPSVVTMDMPYGSDPMQYTRIYKSASAKSGTSMPVIVCYHGGGWEIADVNTRRLHS